MLPKLRRHYSHGICMASADFDALGRGKQLWGWNQPPRAWVCLSATGTHSQGGETLPPWPHFKDSATEASPSAKLQEGLAEMTSFPHQERPHSRLSSVVLMGTAPGSCPVGGPRHTCLGHCTWQAGSLGRTALPLSCRIPGCRSVPPRHSHSGKQAYVHKIIMTLALMVVTPRTDGAVKRKVQHSPSRCPGPAAAQHARPGTCTAGAVQPTLACSAGLPHMP